LKNTDETDANGFERMCAERIRCRSPPPKIDLIAFGESVQSCAIDASSGAGRHPFHPCSNQREMLAE